MHHSAFKLLAMAILTSLAVALAAAPPNFSGVWKANIAKSDFGPMPAPIGASSKIDHQDPHLKLVGTEVREEGERTFEMNISTDGAQTTNRIGPLTLTTKARWEGSTLLVDSKASTDDGEVAIKDQWSLSEDGKTLTVVRNVYSPRGDFTIKVIQEKQ
jgi:ABC-type oligopeptide transport system substrate-binding subunit